MDTATAALIINDDTLTEDQLTVLLLKAQSMAINHYFWKLDDIPTDDEKEAFLSKYEFEIYELAKAMNSDSGREGLTSYTELGITMQWGESGHDTVNKALSAIVPKAYVL